MVAAAARTSGALATHPLRSGAQSRHLRQLRSCAFTGHGRARRVRYGCRSWAPRMATRSSPSRIWACPRRCAAVLERSPGECRRSSEPRVAKPSSRAWHHGEYRARQRNDRSRRPYADSRLRSRAWKAPAFMYACLIHAVPFAQVRAVSNMVERRNRSAWKIDEAIASLCRVAADLIDNA